MKRLHPILIVLAVGCGGGSGSPGSTGVATDDGSDSGRGPTTAASDDGTSDEDAPGSSGSGGASTTATPGDTGTVGGTDTTGTVSADESSSGGAVAECSNEKAPCALELDTPVTGAGGVDEYYVYPVGTGAEHIQFSGIADDYVAWLDSPWAFGCNLEGPCCRADGATTCEKPLTGVFVAFMAGETAYVFVHATGPYELTITGG